MTRYLLILLLILKTALLYSQKVEDMGDVLGSDFSITADSADAVVLFDVERVNLDPYVGVIYRHRRIRILRQSAMDGGKWTDYHFQIPHTATFKIHAITHNLEQGIVRSVTVSDDQIIRSKRNEYYDDVAVPFPNVHVGSILELEYTCRSADRSLVFPVWRFQEDVPVLRSEFTIDAPGSSFYSRLEGNIKPAQYEEKYDGKFRHWVMLNVPPFRHEDLMPDDNRYVSAVRFSNDSDWEPIFVSLRSDYFFWGVLERSGDIHERLSDAIGGITDSLAMVKAISEYIKSKIKFDSIYDFFGDAPEDVLNLGFGDIGDINLTYAAMLKEAGFNVSLVLLSTRDNGMLLDSLPRLDQFDYVVVRVTVKGKKMLLDATRKDLPYDLLPEECLNHEGFLVSDKLYGWISVEPDQKFKVTIEANFDLNDDGSLTGKVILTDYGYAAYEARTLYHKSGGDTLAQKTIDRDWTINEKGFQYVDDLDNPVVEAYSITIPDAATAVGDLLYLNPNLFYSEGKNPFTDANRKYPVDFGLPKDELVMCTITFPKGYTPDYKLENDVQMLPDQSGRWTINFTSTSDKVVELSRLQINSTFFLPGQYAALRDFYTKVGVDKGQVIVLNKE